MNLITMQDIIHSFTEHVCQQMFHVNDNKCSQLIQAGKSVFNHNQRRTLPVKISHVLAYLLNRKKNGAARGLRQTTKGGWRRLSDELNHHDCNHTRFCFFDCEQRLQMTYNYLRLPITNPLDLRLDSRRQGQGREVIDDNYYLDVMLTPLQCGHETLESFFSMLRCQ